MGPHTVLPAGEVRILHHVATIVNASQAGTDPEIHMRHETMLGVVGAHSDCAGVAILDFNIDVGDGRIEGARARIRWLAVGAAPAPALPSAAPALQLPCWRARPSHAAAAAAPARVWPPAGKEQHVFQVVLVLIARRAFSQHEYRPGCTVANQPDSGPDVHRIREPI